MKINKIMFYCFLIFILTACNINTGTNILDKELESGEPYFSILFNHKFAERFSLPKESAVTLSDNLQAIAIEINKVNYRYTCELHLYVDDKLDIYKPVSGDYFVDTIMAEAFFIFEISDKDYAWNIENIFKNKMRSRFDSTLQVDPRLRFTRTLSYNRLHSSFLPGLTMVTLNTHCGIFNKAYYPANVWIQKQNVGDYLVGNDEREEVKRKEKNHRFPIPIALIEQIQPYIEIAEKYNDERL